MPQTRMRVKASRRIKNWIFRLWFGILGRAGYSTLSSSGDEAISQLVAFSAFCILLPFFLVLLVFGIPTVLTALDIDLKDSFILNALISFGLPLAGLMVSFDMIKEVITKEIQALERKWVPDYKELERLRERNKELEKSSDSLLRTEQHKYYLARAYQASKETLNRVSLDRLASLTYSTQYNSVQEAPVFLEHIYADRENRRKLRAAITKIKKESWIKLASSAAVIALEPEQVNEVQLNNDPIKNRLFLDLYLYLDAWLVSSIDNDVAMAIPYMPVEDIGLHYPSEEAPDLDVYERAFSFLIEVFEKGLYEQLISECQSVTPQEIDISKGVSPYLNELIIKLKDFVNS